VLIAYFSSTETSRYDRAEILVKVAISTINQVKLSNENVVKYIELRRIIVINERREPTPYTDLSMHTI
jgi:hypothetical protein